MRRDAGERLTRMNRASFGIGILLSFTGGSFFGLACNGQINAGSESPAAHTLTEEELVAVSQPVTTCPDGSQHASVCCQADANGPPTCEDFPSAPFHACDPGWTTYPDPRTCCSLQDGSCTPAPSGPVPTTGVCQYACPPGQFAAPGGTDSTSASFGEAPVSAPSGGTVTAGTGPDPSISSSGSSGSGTGTGGAISGGTTTLYGSGDGSSSSDSSSDDQPTTCCAFSVQGLVCATAEVPPCACGCASANDCPPCDCASEPVYMAPLTACPSCPAGWQVQSGSSPDLCCRQDPSTGDIDCFSQAVAPPSGGSSYGSGSGSEGEVFVEDAGSATTECAETACPKGEQWNPATCSCD
jgi:hypothetical protein